MAAKPADGAARAGAWSALDVLLRQGLQFLVSVVLARLLVPADFGIMALLSFFTGFGMIVESGFASALIQRSETSREQESALFWIGLACSLVIAALLVLCGPLIAAFFSHPVLDPLMWLAGAQVIAMALGVVPLALLTRALRFKSMAKTALLAAVVSSGVAVVAAVQGAGVWALGFQVLTFTTINSVGAWLVLPWRPVMRFRGAGGRVLLGFSTRVGASQLVDHLYGQGFTLLLGRFHGVGALGLYSRAQATQYFASGTLGTIVRRLALPLFSARASDPAVLRDTIKRTLQMSMVVNLPVMVGLAVTSDLVILVLFGPGWEAAAPILSVLALTGIFWPMQVINSQLLLAMDRPDLYWQTEITKKAVGIGFIVVGSFFGVMGLAWSQVLFSVFAHFFNGWFTSKHAGYGGLRQLGDIAGLMAVCAIMAAAVYFIRPHLDQPPHLLLASLAILGTALCLALGLLLRLPEFREARRVLTNALRRPA